MHAGHGDIAFHQGAYEIVRGLLRRTPHIDLVRIQDVGLCGADDATVLAWNADAVRVLPVVTYK